MLASFILNKWFFFALISLTFYGVIEGQICSPGTDIILASTCHVGQVDTTFYMPNIELNSTCPNKTLHFCEHTYYIWKFTKVKLQCIFSF